MKLLSFKVGDRLTVGAFVDDILVDLAGAIEAYEASQLKKPLSGSVDIVEFLAQGYWERSKLEDLLLFLQNGNKLQEFSVRTRYEIVAPVPRPPKIIALGRNFALHAKEGNYPVPEEPIYFCKTSSSVIGPGGVILVPKEVGRVDHEVELGVVIGKKAKSVKATEAFNFVAGYTITLDISARDLQRSDIEKRHPWYRSKNFDTFTPIGPWIVTADEIPPPIELDIELSVNGQIRQKANTRDMIFDIPTTIEYISRYISLEPGDILSMGTPEGIGPIRDGDRIVSRIEKIGEMVNTVKEI